MMAFAVPTGGRRCSVLLQIHKSRLARFSLQAYCGGAIEPDVNGSRDGSQSIFGAA
jgi:hypothetical protein